MPFSPHALFQSQSFSQCIDIICKNYIYYLCSNFLTPWVNANSDSVNEFVLFQDLGAASQTKRPTSIVLVKSHEDFQENYTECLSEVKSLPLPL